MIITGTVSAQDKMPKLSPQTMKMVYDIQHRTAADPLENIARRKHADGIWYASAMIKVSDIAQALQGLRSISAVTGTKAGDIWTVHVPLDKLLPFTQLQGISYIELDGAAHPNMRQARFATRVDSVHAGYNLPMPYTGKGVIAGVIDFGFDYNHPTFYDTSGSAYRIKKVWELNGSGTPPAGYSYGNEIVDSNDIRARGTDNLEQMHGTATASITAGSGYNTNASPRNRYMGVAFESDMILVGVRRDTIGDQWMQGTFTDFVDGINYIFTQADAAGKPAVVNISWGSQSGPHDGTTLFNQACNNLSGPGKIVVMSAGNEGEEEIHLSKTFTPADTLLSTFLNFNPKNYQRTWVDIWGDTGKTFCANSILYGMNVPGNSTGFFCLDDAVHDTYILSSNGLDTCFVSYIGSTATFNGKPRMIMNVWNKSTDSVAIQVKGTDGRIHMWDEYYFYGFTHGYQSQFQSKGLPGFVSGNTQYTASDMGSGERALLVGAYASKVSWTNINGGQYSYANSNPPYATTGQLVPFSSRGPLTDGRIKPDIAAPGLTLATAVPSYDTAYTPIGTSNAYVVSSTPYKGNNYYYAEFIGTSASAPVASGIVALLLQVKPTLTPEEMKDLVFSTAIEDSYTGNLPDAGNNNWGHGKINAYRAVRKLLTELSVSEYKGLKLDCVLYPNPNSGSFTLDYVGKAKDRLAIEVYDVMGRLVSASAWDVNAGSNRKDLNLGSSAKGVYIVKVSGKSGNISIRTTVQ